MRSVTTTFGGEHQGSSFFRPLYDRSFVYRP